MNIIDKGRAFVQRLREIASRSPKDWRVCSRCGSTETIKNGTYRRRPWFLCGRREMRIQRHLCKECGRTYGETPWFLIHGSRYGREVHRYAIDHWVHLGSSFRRTAEWVRSCLGKQERWLTWRLFDKPPLEDEKCHLSATTVHRWVDRAGMVAQDRVEGQLKGIAISGQMGTDGLWARLRGGATRVVLLLQDSVTGLLLPPVVAKGEAARRPWRRMFERAQKAGLDLGGLRGVTSDGAQGLIGCLKQVAGWANHQSCVWHLWRIIWREITKLTSMAALEAMGEAAKTKAKEIQQEVLTLVRTVVNAPDLHQAEIAWAKLVAHPLGSDLVRKMAKALDETLVHLSAYNQGLIRVAPEWCWRDFRLRLSHGRNHGSDERLERAALLWAIYRNFTPAQERSELKRHYRRPGLSPLEAAGAQPGEVSYLDALAI